MRFIDVLKRVISSFRLMPPKAHPIFKRTLYPPASSISNALHQDWEKAGKDIKNAMEKIK